MALRVDDRDRSTFWNRGWRLENLYKIRTEDKKLRPLKMADRPVQQQLFARFAASAFRGIRIANLKSRKLGITTLVDLFFLDDTILTPNTTSCIIAHKKADLHKIFRILKSAYYSMPEAVDLRGGKTWYKPKAAYDNANELVFNDTNSMIYVALESRGDTNNNLHVSEAAHIPRAEDRMAGTLESVPNRDFGSNVIIETTANGPQGWFYDFWQGTRRGETGYDGVFFAWFMVQKNRAPAPKDFYPTTEEQKLVVDVQKRYGVLLDFDQLYWWRTKKGQQKKKMGQEHPTFEEDAFMADDRMIFDADILRLVFPKEPLRETNDGLKIFVEPKPNRRYVIGVDVAEGVGGDATAVEVLDAVTFEQVAELHSKTIKPGHLGEFVLPRIARLYNEALVVIERNNHGHTVIDRIKDVYTNLFMEVTLDRRTNVKTNRIGWLTRDITRKLMVDCLEELVNDGTASINSAILKSEMLSFITNAKGKPEAKSGQHDDTVMAFGLALKVASMPQSSYAVYEIN